MGTSRSLHRSTATTNDRRVQLGRELVPPTCAGSRVRLDVGHVLYVERSADHGANRRLLLVTAAKQPEPPPRLRRRYLWVIRRGRERINARNWNWPGYIFDWAWKMRFISSHRRQDVRISFGVFGAHSRSRRLHRSALRKKISPFCRKSLRVTIRCYSE